MNTNSGMSALHGGDHGRPVVGLRPRAGALAPGALEGVVHHQHRHVAAHAVALRGDRAERLDHGRAQVGRERVQLHDVRPGGEVRVAAVREHAAADARRTRPGRARGPRRSHARSTRDAPPSTGGRARRDSARSRGSSPTSALGERRACGREARRPAQVRVDRVAADAVRRADDILRSRRRAGRAGSSPPGPSFCERDRDPGRAALPDAHQPDDVEAERGDRVPLGRRARSRGRSRCLRGGSARRARPTC